jgi:pentafunctional AROM polypeptide
MTANELLTTRLLTKILGKKRFAILGHNIAYSVSPQMHTAAFAATRLPHDYVRIDVPTVEEFVNSEFYQAADIGGFSVTIPHKQDIMKYVDVLSSAARCIGSVNTVIVKEEFNDKSGRFERIFYGENTDWRGIMYPLKRRLGRQIDPSRDFVLIVGAGGTARAAAFVAQELGLNLLYFNRTPEKAIELAKTFDGVVLSSLDEAAGENSFSLGSVLRDKSGQLCAVISTLPASAEFVLPEWIFQTRMHPVVFDVNYKPYNTKLLQQAQSRGCYIVRGSEMLWEQGVGQFELWTGRTSPYSIMKKVVLSNCE